VDEETASMNKRVWTLIAVLVVLGALIGGYFWVTRPKPAPVSTEAPKAELSKGDKDAIVKVVLTERAEGTLTFEKKGTDWSVTPALGGTLDASLMDDLLYSFSSLMAERTIEENPTDLAQYGLKPPRATGIATWADGSARTLYLGDKTASGNTYYLQVKGDPKVYTVWMNNGQHLHWIAKDLRSKAITPAINYDEITYLKIIGGNGAPLEIKTKTTDETKSYQLGFGAYMVTMPYSYSRGLDTEKQDALIKAPQSISISDFAEDTKDLGVYGLARPRAEVIVRDKSNTIDFLIGSEKGYQTYFMIRGQPGVYLTDTSSLSFLATKPFDVIDKFTFIPNIDDVDTLEITAAGKTHTLVITRTTKKAEKAGDPDEVVAVYTGDGKTLEEDSFKKFYQSVIGLMVEGESPRKVPNKPEVSVIYHLNKANNAVVRVDYAPYDRDFDAIFLNGVNEFALTKRQLTRMLAKLDTLLAGQTVTD
jgi:hypothetical protein